MVGRPVDGAGENLQVGAAGLERLLGGGTQRGGTPVARLAPSTRTVPGHLLAAYAHPIHRYRMIQLSGPRDTVLVHRLVWRAFRGASPAGRRVAHADDDPANDRLDNLRLATYSEQTSLLIAAGKVPRLGLAGEANGNARLSDADREAIRATLGRETAASVAALRRLQEPGG